MCDCLHKCRLRLVLLVFIAVQLQLGQVLCLQTTSQRTCSLDAGTAPLVEEVSQVTLSLISSTIDLAKMQVHIACHTENAAVAFDVSMHMLIVCLLQIDNWNTFNVFQVGTLSKGSPLETVTLALFARHDLLDKLKIPYDRLQHFVKVRMLVITQRCNDEEAVDGVKLLCLCCLPL